MKTSILLAAAILLLSFNSSRNVNSFSFDEKKSIVIRFTENGKVFDKGKPLIYFKSKTDSIVPVFLNDSTFLMNEIPDSTELFFKYHSFIGSTGMMAPNKFNRIDIDVMYCGENCPSDYAIMFSPAGPFIEYFGPYIKKNK